MLHDLLPPDLRGPATTITPIAAGLSGAGVHRVDAAGQSFVLKVAGENESAIDWRRALHVQRLAAEAGVAPRIVHVDEAARAVLTAFVTDRSFATFYRAPATSRAALALLGDTVRRVHAIPPPADAEPSEPGGLLRRVWSEFLADFAVPPFVQEALQRVLDAETGDRERPRVLSHNDLNPTNLTYDGRTIWVLDWAASGLNDPFYDLATLAMFLRMDDETVRGLFSAYEGRAIDAIPARFADVRRLTRVLVGSLQIHLARQMKHPGFTGAEADAPSPSLGEFYAGLQTGAWRLGTPEGQWAFGLALFKESLAG